MTWLRRLLSPIRPARWPDLLGKVLPKPRRRLLLWRLRYAGWRFHAPIDAYIHPSVKIGRRINVEVRSHRKSRLSIGAGSVIGDDVRLRLRGGSIELGDEVEVRAMCVLNVGGGHIKLDGPNILGWGAVVHCAKSIHLARFVGVAEYATIVDSTHFYTTPDEWFYLNTKTAPIDIGVDVWVCPKSTITSGVTIGDHTIIGPNTVVVKDAPPGVLVSGVPGTVVRELDQPWRNQT